MFQFKLFFKLEQNFLPRELDKLLVSFIKAAAQNYSEEFYNSLYDKSKSIIKTFTFSEYLPGASFQKDYIQLNQKSFTMFFSDADMGQAIMFFNAFKKMQYKQYPMNCNSMSLISIAVQKRREITESELIIKMQSSLIVRRHNSEDNLDVYFTVEDEGFSETIKENTAFFLEKLEMQVSMDRFSLTPLKGKKIVADVFGRKTDASLGVFKMTGTPELLNLLYLAGLGVRRSEGHGKFEIIL